MANAVFSSWGNKTLDGRNNNTKYTSEDIGLSLMYGNEEEVKAIIGWNGIVLTSENESIIPMLSDYFKAVKMIACGECITGYQGINLIDNILTNMVNGVSNSYQDVEILKKFANELSINARCSFCRSAVKPLLDALNSFKSDFDVATVSHTPYEHLNSVIKVSAPCMEACPIHQDIPGYISLIKNEKYDDALKLIKKNNPLAGCTGRACMAFCEKNCVRNDIDKPVAIRLLKRVAYDNGSTPPVTPVKCDKETVAIIGAGPAGIAAAKRLLSLGYKVVIFDTDNTYGGMMNDGIPSYRLPREIIKKDYLEVKEMGADFRIDTPINRLQDIASHYKAVILASGAYASKSNGIEGWKENTGSMYQGTYYLRCINNKKSMELKDRVLVIGGGNTAIDCARTAIRKGAKNVTIAYRRTKNEMPANIEEIEAAESEGCKFEILTVPVKIEENTNGVYTVTCQRMELGEPDASGRRRPVPIPGSEMNFEFDMVLSAIGETPDVKYTADKIELTDWGTIKVNSKGETNMKGIFAAGDCVTGPSSIVEAMASGKHVAENVANYLDPKNAVKVSRDVTFANYHNDFMKHELNDAYDYKLDRNESNKANLEYLTENFEEVELGLDKDTATSEAERCLKCYKVMMIVR